MYKRFKELLYPLKYASWHFYYWFAGDLVNGVVNITIIYASSYVILSLENKNVSNFNFWVILIFILVIYKLIYIVSNDSIWAKAEIIMQNKLDTDLLRRYINLDNNKVETYWTWKMQNILFKWATSWTSFCRKTEATIINFLWVTYTFIIVAIKSPNVYYFAWFSMAFFLIIFLFSKWVKVIQETRIKGKELAIKADGTRVKILMTKFEILQNNKIEKELEYYTKIQMEIANIRWHAWFKKNVWQIWAFAITEWLPIVLFLITWSLIVTWKYSIASLTLLLWLVQNLSKYTWSIRINFRDIYDNLIDIDKLLSLFKEIQPIQWINIKQKFSYKKWDISIKNLVFWYNDNLIYDKFNLDIKWWKKTALVWDSGSGKTTLVKLIAWYVSPNSWDILVDNQNIAEYNLISYYKHIWYLTQEPSVFDGTIRDNLLYALKDEPEISEVNKVIKNAKCEFIYEFPNWLDTEIWEKWIKLSGWQKQRIAIAKIMLKNPNIIILDEPTSALDSISEQFVSEALKNLFIWKTVIIIAHRLQTVKEADDIIVLKDSQIIERWTHSELSKLENWEYKKMLDLQTSF